MRGRRRPAWEEQAMSRGGAWWACVVFGWLSLPGITHAQELRDVAHRYLQRHGVPCQFVVKVGSTSRGLGEFAACQDGREWVLFWLEDEVAFVQPQTRELYKWDRGLYLSH